MYKQKNEEINLIEYNEYINNKNNYIKILTLRDSIPEKFWIPNTQISEDDEYELLDPTKENIKKAENDISNILTLWEKLKSFYHTNHFYNFIYYLNKESYDKKIKIFKYLNKNIFKDKKIEKYLFVPEKHLEIINFRNIIFIIKKIMTIRYEIIKENDNYCIDYSILENIRELKFKQH